jgi:DNA-binding MurR/RpiR family transcriptional regulator
METLDETIREAFQMRLSALSAVSERFETALIEKAVMALGAARRIYCYALGTFKVLASEAEYQLVRLGLNCVAIQDPMQMAIQTSLLLPQDVILIFSHSGCDPRTIQELSHARRIGVTTISITSQQGSPLIEVSDILFVLSEGSDDSQNDSVDARIAALSLIDVLGSCLVFRHVKLGRYVRRFDERLEKM